MILAKVLNKNYWNQNITDTTHNYSEFIKNKDLLLFHSFNISLLNSKEALYNYSNNSINIPKNFYRLDNNYLQFEKIKNEEIPQLNNYSQDKLIKIFINSLNDKNKKEFIKIQIQYSIKEISTLI